MTREYPTIVEVHKDGYVALYKGRLVKVFDGAIRTINFDELPTYVPSATPEEGKE